MRRTLDVVMVIAANENTCGNCTWRHGLWCGLFESIICKSVDDRIDKRYFRLAACQIAERKKI